MDITLPNNGIWNQDLPFHEQAAEAREWILEMIELPDVPVLRQEEFIGVDWQGVDTYRPTKKVYIRQGIKLEIDTVYKNPPSHPASFAVIQQIFSVDNE